MVTTLLTMELPPRRCAPHSSAPGRCPETSAMPWSRRRRAAPFRRPRWMYTGRASASDDSSWYPFLSAGEKFFVPCSESAPSGPVLHSILPDTKGKACQSVGRQQKTQGPGVFPLRALVPFLFRGIDNIVLSLGLCQLRCDQPLTSVSRLRINSLAGDDNDSVLGLVLAGALVEGLQPSSNLLPAETLRVVVALGLVS
mgnify:CR=1 FL=1